MKTKIIAILVAIFTAAGVYAQGNYSVRAVGYDVSDNLDLEAVSYIFGESSNLQDFEARLNDPRMQISNLDLNGDGYVDYLRVVEVYESGMHLITIQAVLDQNVFQDVATIDVGRDNRGSFYVQVIGDPYIYGPNYIIEPAYARIPIIFSWFVRPSYVVWHSPYYWGYYPSRYHHYHCISTFSYNRYLYRHVDYHVHNYYHSDVRRNPRAAEMQRSVRRNDYGVRHPNSSFSSRNSRYANKYEMNRSRSVADQRLGRGSSNPSTYKNSTRYGNTQRSSGTNRYDSKRGTSSNSNRSVTTQPGTSQRSSTYNRNGNYSNQSQRKSSSQSYSRPQSYNSGSSSGSAYQRSSRSSGNNSGYKSSPSRQSQMKSSSSSSRSGSTYKPSQSRKVESSSRSSRSSSGNTGVSSRSSRSSSSSSVKKSSSRSSKQNSSSNRSSRSRRN